MSLDIHDSRIGGVLGLLKRHLIWKEAKSTASSVTKQQQQRSTLLYFEQQQQQQQNQHLKACTLWLTELEQLCTRKRMVLID